MKRLLLTILCGILLAFCTLLTACTQKDENKEEETEEAAKAGDIEEKMEMIYFSNLTTLEVITDSTQFTPVTEDQSYQPETDMNPNADFGSNFIDVNGIVYMCQSEGGLIAFWKDTGSVGIACDKPDCEHDVKTAGGDCQANLHVLDLNINNLQYYKGDIYYTLGGTILYKMSLDREIKYQYVSLLGEKGYGTGAWLIHRGNIYYYARNEGIYKMPVDNPSYKELIVKIPEGTSPTVQLQAYGSYIYFMVFDSKEMIYGAARYNTESNQIEQFLNMKENLNNIVVHDGKIYYTEYQRDGYGNIYRYDIASGENEVFLQGEKNKNMDVGFWLSCGDTDYIYITKEVHIKKDYYDGGGEEYTSSYLVYTWDGELAGEILDDSEEPVYYEKKPLEIFHRKYTIGKGSDSDKIYYMSIEYDLQVAEDGIQIREVEGSQKVVVSYIDKSELSTDTAVSKHIAGEVYE